MFFADSVCENSFPISVRYTHELAVKVVAIAVRIVMRMLRMRPQVELLLNVPILFRLQIKEYRVQMTEYRVQIVYRLG